MKDVNQLANQFISVMSSKDDEIEYLMSQIQEGIDCLSNNVSNKQKLDAVVSIEYLFVKLRTLVEFESINVKKILNSDVIVSVKALFTKRDVYLSQVSLKLTTIQNDINNLQKLVYINNNKF